MGQEVVDAIKEKCNERCKSRSRWKMIESHGSHQTTELVAYHIRKQIFLSLAQMEKEDPDELQIYEFRGQDFELIVD